MKDKNISRTQTKANLLPLSTTTKHIHNIKDERFDILIDHFASKWNRSPKFCNTPRKIQRQQRNPFITS